MNLFEEVKAISNSSLAMTKHEFDNIASEIKLTALTGSRSVYILGSISEHVKDELRQQGFIVEYKSETGQRYGYIIKWQGNYLKNPRKFGFTKKSIVNVTDLSTVSNQSQL